MKVAVDADALIKITKAGFIEVLASHAELIIGPHVYREAVVEGKARGYPDAYELEKVLDKHARVRQRSPKPRRRALRLAGESVLGAGELEAMELYAREGADAVLSDDRAFLSALVAQAVPFLTPAAVLLFLTARKSLAFDESEEALKRLRPLIRSDQYQAALADLQELRRNR